MADIKNPKKLIEVALPLDDINEASAKEKSIRFGHPSTLHLWWARRPLATARAVIFAQMVNDPGYERHLGRGMNKKDAALERERLFQIIRDLVKWENTNNEEVLDRAREEIKRSWVETCELNKNHPKAAELFNPHKLPAFHDPFAGGGTIPLEAQRLGLESYASDLNPVAVTINKALLEIPPKFANRSPVGRLPLEEDADLVHEKWTGARGLAEDVRRYGRWMREAADKLIGHLYPQVEVTDDMAKDRPDLRPYIGKKLTVIAWISARTVKSSNPAYSHVDVPLASTFVLSNKDGQEAWIEPIISGDQYRFVVRMGKPPKETENGTKLARGANFRCIVSNSPIGQAHIREEFKAKRAGSRLMAIVAEGKKGRVFISPVEEHEKIALQAKPEYRPEIEMNQDSKDLLSGRGYGFKWWYELFTSRQLVALTTFSDLVQEVVIKCKEDAIASGMPDDGKGLDSDGRGATAYAEAVAVYLTLAVSKLADSQNSLVSWKPSMNQAIHLFTKQAIPMVWDFAEPNIFGGGMGDYIVTLNNMMRVLDSHHPNEIGMATQQDASRQQVSIDKIISFDPPYYDNISYADLSDFFYIWLRRSLRPIFPTLYATMSVPKSEELVATSYRHTSKDAAEAFFLEGMKQVIKNLAELAHPAFPVTIYYAFKQTETEDETGSFSTGWETFLEAVLHAGFALTGTWPMRTEMSNRVVGIDTNALASSIVLVCRKRQANAVTISRREFVRELNAILPDALDEMTCGDIHSPVAPVDLSQAIIGPGMAIFSKYSAVLEADGKPMTVRTALQLINRFLSEDEFDHDTQFCLHWFDSFGWGAGKFGEANVLAQAKGVSVDGVADAGVIESGEGTVRLLKFIEYPSDWNPEGDQRMPIWEALHHMIRVLRISGEGEAGKLFGRIHKQGEPIRALAYRLYTLCERRGWAEDARAYNDLVTSWPQIEAASHKEGRVDAQAQMDFTEEKK